MVVELLDDASLFEDDARLAARLAFFEMPDTGPEDLPPWPEDQRAQAIAEILALVDRLGPCSDSVMLLESLADRQLTEDEWLSVALAWRPVLAWATGSQLSAVAAFAGPVPPEVLAAQGIARGEDIDPAVSELSAALGAHRGVAASLLHEARLLYGSAAAQPADDAQGPHDEERTGSATPDPGPCGEGLLLATGQALLAGRIDARRATFLVQQLSVLPSTVGRKVEAGVLPRVMNGTMANLRAKIRRRVMRADPEAAVTTFVEGRKDRRLEMDTAGEDGLVGLFAALPPAEGVAVFQRLEQLAGRGHPDDGRSKPQRLADALVGCVLGFEPRCCRPCPQHAPEPARPGSPSSPGSPGADDRCTCVGCGPDCGPALVPTRVPVTVQVTIDLPTLLRLRDNPGELHGFGPIPAEVARSLAADAAWQRFVHDPVDGQLIDRGHTSYAPGTTLSGFVRGRDVHCRFPGCTRDIDDLDHNEPWNHGDPSAGGVTSSGNLAGLCRYHHRVKTHKGFHVTNHGNGVLTWTTPSGRTSETRPSDYRPDADTDPP